MVYIGTSRSLNDKTPDELAAHIWLHGRESSSITYARQVDDPKSRVEKASARSRVTRLFSKTEWPKGLSILTMPGLGWEFERNLLHDRERERRLAGKRPERTYICAIEWDEAIFRCGLKRIPDGGGHLVQVSSPEFASDSYRTLMIARYHRCRFEDLAEWYVHSSQGFDAAWLDFSGPVTASRMVSIQRFWLSSLRWRMVVTAMNARWDAEASEMIGKAGGVTQWFANSLPGSRLILDDRYQTGVPMLQVGFDRDQ